jgi:hypothetical protein
VTATLPGLVVACALAAAPAVDGQHPAGPVPPADTWTCPATHPIKAVMMRGSGACLYHVPDGPYYRSTRPQACFASEAEARQDGCSRAEEVL